MLSALPLFLLPLLPLSLTTPSPEHSSITVPSRYYLKTCILTPNDSDKNELYVWPYHTGAGLNDVVLRPRSSFPSSSTPPPAFLNGTYQQFDFNTTFPWGFYMGGASNYAGWEFVSLNVGYGDEGFFVNNTGLQWREDFGFGGWLACDWWHGLPQLFWRYRYYDYQLPKSCARVLLVLEEV